MIYKRLLLAWQAALLAAMLALNSGLPFWNGKGPIGSDAFDFGLVSFVLAWLVVDLLAPPRQPGQ